LSVTAAEPVYARTLYNNNRALNAHALFSDPTGSRGEYVRLVPPALEPAIKSKKSAGRLMFLHFFPSRYGCIERTRTRVDRVTRRRNCRLTRERMTHMGYRQEARYKV